MEIKVTKTKTIERSSICIKRTQYKQNAIQLNNEFSTWSTADNSTISPFSSVVITSLCNRRQNNGKKHILKNSESREYYQKFANIMQNCLAQERATDFRLIELNSVSRAVACISAINCKILAGDLWNENQSNIWESGCTQILDPGISRKNLGISFPLHMPASETTQKEEELCRSIPVLFNLPNRNWPKDFLSEH